MNEQAVRFRLGVFVLSALVLLAVLIVLFGGRPTFFQKTDKYTIAFDSAPDVQPGTPVRKSGVKIGEVDAVELDNDTGKVSVTVRVDDRYSLRKSEVPTLKLGLLGGDAVIDFEPPPEGVAVEPGVHEPGALIQGKTTMDATELVQKAGKVMPPAEDAMKEMSKVLNQMDKMMPLMEDTLKEFRAVAKSTNELVPAVRDTNKELQKLVDAANKTVPNLNRTLDEVQVTSRMWGKLGERLDVLLQTNEKKMVKALDDLSKTLEEMAKVFSKDNQEAVSEILRNTSAASKQLDSIARNTDLLLKDTRKTMTKVNDSVEKADRVFDNLEKVTKPMSERSERILKNLDEATAQLNVALGEFRVLMQGVSRGEGTFNKFLTDPLLYNRLNEAAFMANKLFPKLDRILDDVEVFADKIARHPEVLGVGGALRPSSGLKDLPPYPTVLPSHAPAPVYEAFPPVWRSHP